ncbi:hypothetical protein D3C78_1039120 [compost metagenome]
MQRSNGLFRIVTQRIAQRQNAFCDSVYGHNDDGLPGLFQLTNLLTQRLRREFIGGGDQHFFAVYVGFDS